ncbi:MAG: glycoside hydrolase family 16 protein [Candidatus Nanopelagicaceae bacterium]
MLDRSKYELEFEDDFSSLELDRTKWFPYYLPQWKNKESTRARFRLDGGQLRLLIEEDQDPWAPELNGEIRVSNFQTGVFSGPLGTPFGQHRFREGLLVQEAQEPLSLYTPTHGLIELRAKAIKDPECLVALWLIGFESDPADSAEICVMEIFGKEIDNESALVGVGIKRHHDPRVHDDFSKVTVEADVCDWHTYSVEWTPKSISFYFDEEPLKVVDQSINYPMQLMLNIYEFNREAGTGPKEFAVDWVRGYVRSLARHMIW